MVDYAAYFKVVHRLTGKYEFKVTGHLFAYETDFADKGPPAWHIKTDRGWGLLDDAGFNNYLNSLPDIEILPR